MRKTTVMSTLSTVKITIVGLLSSTALAGAVYVPSASAAEHNSSSATLYAQRYRSARYCIRLRRRISDARFDRNYRRARILQRQYDRNCSRRGRVRINSRYCRRLRADIRFARRDRFYSEARRLQRRYDRSCYRRYRYRR